MPTTGIFRACSTAAGSRVSTALSRIFGVSSLQLDAADRGFSFRRDEPFDMRMDRSQGRDAGAAAARHRRGAAGRCDLSIRRGAIFASHRPRHRDRLASARRWKRRDSLPTSCAGPCRARVISASTRRRARFRLSASWVNRELEGLDAFLASAAERLLAGARLAVISFHSLEDRIVETWVSRARAGRRGTAHRDETSTDAVARPKLKQIHAPEARSCEQSRGWHERVRLRIRNQEGRTQQPDCPGGRRSAAAAVVADGGYRRRARGCPAVLCVAALRAGAARLRRSSGCSGQAQPRKKSIVTCASRSRRCVRRSASSPLPYETTPPDSACTGSGDCHRAGDADGGARQIHRRGAVTRTTAVREDEWRINRAAANPGCRFRGGLREPCGPSPGDGPWPDRGTRRHMHRRGGERSSRG